MDSPKHIERITAEGVVASICHTRAGAARGRYLLAHQPVDLITDSRVVLAGLSLAGAIRMAAINPARACKLPARAQSFVPGAPADIVQFRLAASQAIEIVATWLAGQRIL